MTQPEALRLAEVSPYLEGGERGQWIIDAADELRRLHAENEKKSEAIQRLWKERDELRVQRDALLEALQFIAGHDLLGTDLMVAGHMTHGFIGRSRAAIAKAEEKT